MRKGQRLSEEARAKISLKLLGKRSSMRTEFKKGRISWNKGTKGICKANSGSYKKGNVPYGYMGGYKILKDDGIYVRIKKETYQYGKNKVGKYEQLARVKYRQAYGDFNGVILHKDGDVMNCELENLQLITRAELLRRNQYKNTQKCVVCGKDYLARVKKCKICQSSECKKEYNKICNRNWRLKNKIKIFEYKKDWKKNRNSKIRNTVSQRIDGEMPNTPAAMYN